MQHQNTPTGEQNAKPTNPTPEPTTTTTYTDIPTHLIHIGPQQLRSDPMDDDIAELAADIAAHGLLQPIGLAPIGDGRYQLLYGSRRLAAYRRLNRPTIPAKLHHHTDQAGIVTTAIRENILRRNLTLREEIDAIRRLTADGLSPNQISDLCGKSRNWVNRRLAVDNLPPELRQPVLDGDLPIAHAEAIAKIEDPGTRSYLANYAIREHPSFTTLAHLVETAHQTPTLIPAIEEGTACLQSPKAPPEPHWPCVACGDLHPRHDLRMILVCKDCHTIITQDLPNARHQDTNNGTAR